MPPVQYKKIRIDSIILQSLKGERGNIMRDRSAADCWPYFEIY